MGHKSSRMTVLIVILVVVCTLSVRAWWDDNGNQVSFGERNELYPRIAADTLVSSVLNPSIFVQRIDGDGRDIKGNDVASGVYFYRLITPEFGRTRKMTLIR